MSHLIRRLGEVQAFGARSVSGFPWRLGDERKGLWIYARVSQRLLALLDPQRQPPRSGLLMWMAQKGYDDCINALLESGADPDKLNTLSMTALDYSAKYGHVSALRRLLDAGASILGPGRSALNYAVIGGQEETVRLLLEAGADPNALDFETCSLKSWAVQSGNQEIARLIEKHGGM